MCRRVLADGYCTPSAKCFRLFDDVVIGYAAATGELVAGQK
jgi:hypothetical protein